MIYIIISSILMFVILVVLILSFIIYRKAFYNDRKNKPKSFEPISKPDYLPFMDQMVALLSVAKSLEYKYVYIKSFDKKKLAAKLYLHDATSPFVIEVHGYKGSGVRDFSGGLTEFYNMGYNVLLIDHRGHGESDGRTITFGAKESKDVYSWIEYLNKNFNEPEIILYGISMGGNTVLNVSKMNLTKNILAIISDCPYSTPKDIVYTETKKLGFNLTLAKPFINLAALLYAHFSLNSANAIEAVKETKVPILLIHSKADLLVPYQMSEKIYDSNREKIELLLVEGAPHGLSYILDRDLVISKINEFIAKAKGSKENS